MSLNPLQIRERFRPKAQLNEEARTVLIPYKSGSVSDVLRPNRGTDDPES